MSSMSPYIANRIPNYDTETLSSIDLTTKSSAIDYFTANLSANASLVLHDETHVQLKDGAARYLTIKNTHATNVINIALPAPFVYYEGRTFIPILNLCQTQIQFYWDLKQLAWFFYDTGNWKRVNA